MPVTVLDLKAHRASLQKIAEHCANATKRIDAQLAKLAKERTAPKPKK
jgi:hypothetical protein